MIYKNLFKLGKNELIYFILMVVVLFLISVLGIYSLAITITYFILFLAMFLFFYATLPSLLTLIYIFNENNNILIPIIIFLINSRILIFYDSDGMEILFIIMEFIFIITQIIAYVLGIWGRFLVKNYRR